ncbi:MAG: DUF4433 domain-containing protein [Cytophagales bacterium]|nr:DUF4433 domain-containing protein [Cytophagales bacterium]
MSVPKSVLLYRMVHWKNVQHILQHGICSRQHPDMDPKYINIGHGQLITDRHEHPIPLPNAGNLGEYVPFYFAGHTPMLYVIMNGYQGIEQRSQEDIVFLVSTFDKIKKANLEFVFTNMNAKIALAEFYNNESDFNKIHWNIVKAKQWANDESNLSRRDYKQAEFLVRDHVPISCISSIVVKSDKRKAHFEKMLLQMGLSIKVLVDKNCNLYY